MQILTFIKDKHSNNNAAFRWITSYLFNSVDAMNIINAFKADFNIMDAQHVLAYYKSILYKFSNPRLICI